MLSRFTNYIRETRLEMRKVNWPTRAQTVQSTILVIVISIIVALYLGAFDLLFQYLLRTILT